MGNCCNQSDKQDEIQTNPAGMKPAMPPPRDGDAPSFSTNSGTAGQAPTNAKPVPNMNEPSPAAKAKKSMPFNFQTNDQPQFQGLPVLGPYLHEQPCPNYYLGQKEWAQTWS